MDGSERVGLHGVPRLMRQLGFEGCPKKRYEVTTDGEHGLEGAPHRLERNFTAAAPKRC